MYKTPLDKDEIVTRRAPRWAWQDIDMVLATKEKTELPFKAVQFSSAHMEITSLSKNRVIRMVHPNR